MGSLKLHYMVEISGQLSMLQFNHLVIITVFAVTNIGRGGRTSVGGRQSFGSANSAGSSRKRPVSRFRMGPPTTSRRLLIFLYCVLHYSVSHTNWQIFTESVPGYFCCTQFSYSFFHNLQNIWTLTVFKKTLKWSLSPVPFHQLNMCLSKLMNAKVSVVFLSFFIGRFKKCKQVK